MDLFLSISATGSIVLSSILALGLSADTKGFTKRTPSGPDAMGIIVYFIGCLAGWGLTLLAAWLAAGRGGFVWFLTPAPAACILLLFVAAALAFLSVMALGASLENSRKHRTLYGYLGALALPLAANAFVLYLAWADPAGLAASTLMRLLAIPFGLVAAGSLITAVVLYVRAQGKAAQRQAVALQREREQIAQNEAEAIERDARHRAELEALPDDTPLTVFVTHLFIDKSERHHRLVLERIGGLADLAARFDRELEHPEPLQREYLLNYFRMADALDPGVAAALRPAIARCFDKLGEDLDRAAGAGQAESVRHVFGMTKGLLLSAAKFGEPRFESQARRLRGVLERWPTESKVDAMKALDQYLAGQVVSPD